MSVSGTGPAVAVDALQVRIGSNTLMGPVSFEVGSDQTLVIMGETGAGKSLVVQAILGTLPEALQAAGTIEVDGVRVDEMPLEIRAQAWGLQITALPQEPWRALSPLKRSANHVLETHRYVAQQANPKASCADVFDTLGLTGAEARLPGALSGGMAQRVAFAAAIKVWILIVDHGFLNCCPPYRTRGAP